MAPPLPEPEHLPWYMWLLGAITTAAGWLAAKLAGRAWRQVDGNEKSLRVSVDQINEKLSDHGVRLAVLEERSPVTMEDLRKVVEQALDRVEERFGNQHKGLAEGFAEALRKNREDMEERVSECNRALRSDIELLVKTLPETLGRLFDSRAIGRRRKRGE